MTEGLKPLDPEHPLYVDAAELSPNMIDHPPHYNKGNIEVFDVLDDWSEAGMISYCISNVIKYCARYRHKADPLQDLLKAKWYLEKEIDKCYKDETRESDD